MIALELPLGEYEALTRGNVYSASSFAEITTYIVRLCQIL